VSRAIDAFLGLQLIVGLIVAVAVSVVVAPPVARRFRLTRGAAYAGALSTIAILSITLFDRSGLAIGFDLGRALTWWTTQRESVIDVARSEPQWFLNVALFVPAAVVWTVVTKRPIRVAALLAAYSFGIETLQGLTGYGAADVTDLAANALGAALGALGAAIVLRSLRTLLPDVTKPDPDELDQSRLTPGWVAGSLLATSMLIGVVFFGVQAVVARRQTQLRHEVERVFAGLTIGDINEIRNPNAVGLSPFFDLVSVRPDSYQFFDDERPVEVRYPVDFLGAYRCVFVTFSNASPVFDNGSGQECTEDRYATTDG
jgi:VanZ like family